MSFQQNDETAAKTSQSLRWAAAFIKICAARSLSAGYLLSATARDSLPYAFFRRTGRILGRLFAPPPGCSAAVWIGCCPACPPSDRR